MLNLQLPATKDESTLALLREIDKQGELNTNPDACFWLGSVSTENKEAFQSFLKAAEEENLQELMKHSAIGANVAYAVLARDSRSETRFHLFVIESGGGLWTTPKFLLGRPLSMEYSVTTKPSTPVPDGIETHPRLELWKSFIGGFFRK